VVLGPVADAVAIGIASAGVRAEALLPEVAEAVVVIVLGRIDDAIAVGISSGGRCHAVSLLEAITQPIPVAITGDDARTCEHHHEERQD
jgi:hypothetical protein